MGMQPLSSHPTNPIPMPTLSSKPGSGRPTRKMSMRIVASTICALALAGCASNLPYSIAIGDPNGSTSRVGQKDCVLRLDDIVKKVADDYSSSESDVRSLQVQFETMLHEGTQTLEHCNDGNGNPVQHDSFPPIEEIAKKWLTYYALDTTNPDLGLDRFREYVRSAQVVQYLARQQLLPDVEKHDTSHRVEKTMMMQSEWCGSAPPHIAPMQAQTEEEAKKSPCSKERSLYHVQAKLTAPEKGKTTEDLYKHLLADIVQVETTGTRNQRYLMLGYEIPWDEDRTVVRYGVTFYFKQTGPENGEPLPKEKHPILIGYDLVYANEATPAPFIAQANGVSEQVTGESHKQHEKEKSPWIDNPWAITGYPFSLVIGLKNAAFEIAKLPFSTVAGLLFGRDSFNYPLENLLTAYDALYVEAFTQTHRGAEWGIYRLLTEMPLVGQLFQYNFADQRDEPDVLINPRRKIFLSRGIYGGNKWGQDTGLWTLMARQSYPTYDIYSPPYRHGSVVDVLWSMFNLSHGPAFNEARYVMDHATRDDRLYLAGHSGGVQRSAVTSRILTNLGYRVVKVMGIAGPSIGQALVDSRYPEAFKVYLNTRPGANQDVVSKVGVVAGAYSMLLDYSVLVPLKYTLGTLGGLAIGDRERAYRIADGFGFSNASIVEVGRQPSSRHQTPMRLSFTDRLVFDAYIRNEFSTAFRDDLERPDRPNNKDHTYTFPWEP